jgi:hypothetical protein
MYWRLFPITLTSSRTDFIEAVVRRGFASLATTETKELADIAADKGFLTLIKQEKANEVYVILVLCIRANQLVKETYS